MNRAEELAIEQWYKTIAGKPLDHEDYDSFTEALLVKTWQASRELTIKEYEAKQSSGGEPVALIITNKAGTESQLGFLKNKGMSDVIADAEKIGMTVQLLYLAQPDQSARIAELTAKVSELDGQLGKRNLNKEHEYLAKIATLTAEVKKWQENSVDLEYKCLDKNLEIKKLREALSKLVKDLKMRADMGQDDAKGVVACGNGVWIKANEALAVKDK